MSYDSYSGTSEYTAAARCRHVKSRTVEDVLCDGICRTATESQTVGIEIAIRSVVPDLAAEIRELMGVDE